RLRAQALRESKAQLLEIAERWALAQRLGAFFAEIERSLSTQDGESRELLEARLAEARALLGGADALEHFKGGWGLVADCGEESARSRSEEVRSHCFAG